MYDGEDVVLVYAGSSAGSLTNRYLVGPNIDEILADENAAGVVTWSLADNLGTVRDLAQYNTATNTTTVVNHVKYDTFGQIKSQSNPGAPGLFAYTGREWDSDAGMYYYRARWYDARVGRFLSEDPIGFAAGDVNLSRYVANRATMWVDPSGLQSTSIPSEARSDRGTHGQSNSLSLVPGEDRQPIQIEDTESATGTQSSGYLSSSSRTKKGGTGTPMPPPGLIGNGFPTTLPPNGQVTVVIAQRVNHTFIIILDQNGQTTYFSGRPNQRFGNDLKVTMGPYGTGDEPFFTMTEYNDVGYVPADRVDKLREMMKTINANKEKYGVEANNCNTTTCIGLTVLGRPIPTQAIPGKHSRLPGWGEPPLVPPLR